MSAMQLFVSDLHLTDHDDGCAPSDKQLLSITRTLNEAPTGEKHTLVLLGDIVDLLRSEQWHELWQDGESPWRDRTGGRNEHFKRFAGSRADDCATAIARRTVDRYPQFRSVLRTLVQAGRLRVVYIPGNHDYMAQLSKQIREVLVDAFSVSHDPKNIFPQAYLDKPTSVYAIHGHAYDPVNWHRKPEGYWAFGDAIVLRLVNRMLRESPSALQTAVAGIGDLDAIEPVIDTPVFIRWLAQTLPDADRKKLESLWKHVVKELLALPDFCGKASHAAATERKALRLSASLAFADFLVQHESLVAKKEDRWVKAIEDLTSRGRAKQYRYVVLGHTHDARIALLSKATPQEPRYYVNTGCWRKIVARPSREQKGPFIATRVSTMFLIEPGTQPTYKLLREWHAN
jgi:UDP-2,3-diacylglucosamine pyrophosphatase LpxH